MKKFVSCSLLLISIISYYPLLCRAGSEMTRESNIQTIGVHVESKEGLEIEKLKQEVLKIQLENENLKSSWTKFSSNSAFIMAIVALIGVFGTIWQQFRDSRRQRRNDDDLRKADSKQRELDRIQREVENQRLIDQNFTSVVADLGAEREAVQASAAVSIITFLKPEYETLHNRILAVLLANLKISHSDSVNRLISEAFEKALQVKLKKDDKFELNISRANLKRVDLSELNLTQTDLGYAQLQHANLTGTNLFRSRGYEANLEKSRLSRANLGEARLQNAKLNNACLHDCNLVAADFKNTSLCNVEFQRSKMQSAHFEGSDITGAKFEQANIDDAYFTNVKVDNQTLRSLTKAKNWQNAHFDDEIWKKLNEIA